MKCSCAVPLAFRATRRVGRAPLPAPAPAPAPEPWPDPATSSVGKRATWARRCSSSSNRASNPEHRTSCHAAATAALPPPSPGGINTRRSGNREHQSLGRDHHGEFTHPPPTPPSVRVDSLLWCTTFKRHEPRFGACLTATLMPSVSVALQTTPKPPARIHESTCQ